MAKQHLTDKDKLQKMIDLESLAFQKLNFVFDEFAFNDSAVMQFLKVKKLFTSLLKEMRILNGMIKNDLKQNSLMMRKHKYFMKSYSKLRSLNLKAGK